MNSHFMVALLLNSACPHLKLISNDQKHKYQLEWLYMLIWFCCLKKKKSLMEEKGMAKCRGSRFIGTPKGTSHK